MKAEILILVIYVCACFGDSDWKVFGNNYKGERYTGNPDDFGDIVRPCQVYDLNCIRLFFAKHSKCNIVYGPLPDTLIRSQVTLNLARLNTSITFTNIQQSGFNNTRISEFYINKVTNNVVFAIELRDYREVSPTGYFRFYRRGREPITSVASAEILYSSLIVTAVIPNIDDMKLDEAEVTLFSNDPIAQFTVSPGVLNEADETVVQDLAGLIADQPTDIQELFLTESPYYPAKYIQTNICDFGLKVL